MNIFKRPTLFGLMTLIAYIAVGMTAIRSDNNTWAGIVMYLTVFILCFATLVAIDRRGAWAGFAIFGWAYFLTFQPNAAENGPSSVSMQLAHDFVRYFTHSNVPDYSLRSGLSLCSVIMGFLGAFVAWLVGRESDTSRGDHGSQDSGRGVLNQ